MRVREAQLGDFEIICELLREVDELHAEILPGFFRKPKRGGRSRESIRRIVEAKDETILVALDHIGEVVGLVHVQIYDTPAVQLMVPKRRAHIDNLVVSKSMRRRGLGTRLLEAASKWARGKHAQEILLTVWEGNKGAERFYARMGFTRVNMVLGREP
jgi:ribosomal protein S18 acetylase RimI-like enzyme